MLIQAIILFFFKHLFFHDYPSNFLSNFLLKQWMGLQMRLCACIYMDECGCLENGVYKYIHVLLNLKIVDSAKYFYKFHSFFATFK